LPWSRSEQTEALIATEYPKKQEKDQGKSSLAKSFRKHSKQPRKHYQIVLHGIYSIQKSDRLHFSFLSLLASPFILEISFCLGYIGKEVSSIIPIIAYIF